MGEEESSRVEALIRLILSYLRHRPEAADTIRGIRDHWIPWQQMRLVERAVGVLDDRGEAVLGAGLGGDRMVWLLERGAEPSRR